MTLGAAAPAITLLMAVPADAHRRWLLPSATVLSGDSETVTVDAASSNGLFLFEHNALPLSGLEITGPDGRAVAPNVIGSGEYRSVFDVSLQMAGTYRIALRRDQIMARYTLNGEEKRWRGTTADLDGAIPAEAQDVRVSRTDARIETFATLGAPNDTALQPIGEGLEMVPVSHPNDLVVGEEAQFRFLLNGEPAAGLEVEIVPGGTRYRDDARVQMLTADQDGIVSFTADAPGFWYFEAAADAGTPVDPRIDVRRASYSAVLEVLPL
ncbi:Nikel transport family protein NikM [Pacificimonas flava]|uniref:Nikel transport family protein NikM n=2 Tax=Pacificimonas flava TaxID=1234595 RepID=M2SBZ0_9SPHN|nr:Nikel transport family protein NikM [Pacificimonas flava]